jgi:hypothetical protein
MVSSEASKLRHYPARRMAHGPDGDAFWLRLQAEHDLWHARTRLKSAVAKIKPAPREPKERATAA